MKINAEGFVVSEKGFVVGESLDNGVDGGCIQQYELLDDEVMNNNLELAQQNI